MLNPQTSIAQVGTPAHPRQNDSQINRLQYFLNNFGVQRECSCTAGTAAHVHEAHFHQLNVALLEDSFSGPSVCFPSVQIAVTLFLALVVGAIFFDVKDDQSGIQNRSYILFRLCLLCNV